MTRHRSQPLSLAPILLALVSACLPELWPEPSETPKQGAVAIAISNGGPPDTVPSSHGTEGTTQAPFEVAVGQVLRLRITGKLETSNIRWTSSDPSIVDLELASMRVDEFFVYKLYRDELVTGKKPGTATVLLKVDGQRDSVIIRVRPKLQSNR